MNKNVFKRYELKYVLTLEQYKIVLQEIKKHLGLDKFGLATIQSLYYDTDNYRLIRNSIERPDYKEKIRVRSYGLSNPEKLVFLELKKKSEKVVFKRRIEIKEKDIESFIQGNHTCESQIEKEIQYFCNYYKNLKPSMLMIYDREAYSSSQSDIRITFDKNIRYRTEDLSLCSNLEGKTILPNEKVIMEIKTCYGYPFWLVELLSNNKIYKSRFSKYGTAYQMELKKQIGTKKEENCYV